MSDIVERIDSLPVNAGSWVDSVLTEARAEITRLREALSSETAARENAEREKAAALGLVEGHALIIADLTRKLEAAAVALTYYADTFCELGEHHECCGKLSGDECSGCRAREAHAEILGKEKS